MKSFFASALLGLLALALVNLTSEYTGVCLAASSALGVPGVTLLVVLNTIL